MNILGLSYGLHDSSVCVIKEGKLKSAIASERLSRFKKDGGMGSEAINYVLKESDLKLENIDYIAIVDYHQQNVNNELDIFWGVARLNSTWRMVFGQNIAEVKIKLMGIDFKGFVISHHMAHAASAFYTSNFKKSWVFSMDSCFHQPKDNSLLAFGDDKKLHFIKFPNLMVGVGYAAFTHFLFEGHAFMNAGKTMGLASYGTPNQNIKNNINKYIKEMYFETEEKQEVYTKYFDKLFLEISNNKYREKMGFKEKANVAATIQYLFEESILSEIKKIENKKSRNICLSGGSFLNCNVNTRIKKETKFENIHHFPACGDDGLSVGGALFVLHHILDQERVFYEKKEIIYTGKKYKTIEPDYDYIAKKISEGKIVAWFMGGSEFGPRALGGRSILADPRSYHTREILNFSIKNREWFRPYAPVILEECLEEWFDFKGSSELMLYTANVLQPEKIPAATHVDNTARMQTINKETNLYYYKIIQAFYKLTGVPILINTSLNGNSEPIVETEEDVLSFFNKSDLDILVLNGKIIEKDDAN